MEELYNLAVLITECLSTFINIHIVYKRKIKVDKWSFIFALCYTMYFFLVTIIQPENYFDIISPIAILVWTKKVFVRKWFETILRIAILMVFSVVEQTSIMFLTIIVLRSQGAEAFSSFSYYGMVLATVIASMIVYYLIVIKDMLKQGKHFIKHGVKLIYILVVALVVYLITLMKNKYYTNKDVYVEVYIVCALVLLVAVIIALSDIRTKRKLYQKQLELELNSKYMKTYEELILSMRQKQHDYKNQLSALYSMHHVAEDKEQLVKMQREYGDELVQKDSMDNILFQCDNPVICGYVYTMCLKAGRDGIKVQSNLSCDSGDFLLPLYKIIEIVGILLDNAIEYLRDSSEEEKLIRLNVQKEQETLVVEVENPAPYFSYEEQDKMFEAGYSTKGEGRGIGLSSLKTIVKELKGNITVENVEVSDKNWFRIKVEV